MCGVCLKIRGPQNLPYLFKKLWSNIIPFHYGHKYQNIFYFHAILSIPFRTCNYYMLEIISMQCWWLLTLKHSLIGATEHSVIPKNFVLHFSVLFDEGNVQHPSRSSLPENHPGRLDSKDSKRNSCCICYMFSLDNTKKVELSSFYKSFPDLWYPPNNEHIPF